MINPMDMTGRCMLVTGASSGLGREISICLSQLGSRVILVARNEQALELTATMMEGKDHAIEPFDLSNSDEVPLWMKGLSKKYGLLDGIIHSAGQQLTRPLRDWTLSDCQKLMNINLNCCFALAKGFRQRGVHKQGGSIVFLSSVAGLVGETGLSIYSATKSAIIGLTRSLAVELVRDGIRVNAVAPGFVHTEMVDDILGFMPPDYLTNLAAKHLLGLGQPRDVANAVAFLMGDTGHWITGTTMVVDGGYTA